MSASTSGEVEITGGPAATRRRTFKIVAGIVVLAVVAAGGWGIWWLRHPTNFANTYGNGEWAHLQVGQTALATTAFSPGVGRVSQVHIDALDPRVVQNTSGGTVRFELCTIRRSGTAVGMDIGGLARLNRYCSAITPAVGADFSLVKDKQELVMVYTPARPGLIRVAGVDMTYKAGWQEGTEHIGVDTTLYVR
jgi:hypothetical protein